jgi:hypothetical protein
MSRPMLTETPTPVEVVLTNEGELFVQPGARLVDARDRKRIMEMLCGWSAVHNVSIEPKKLMQSTQKNWEHAIGLVVCGLAERIQL